MIRTCKYTALIICYCLIYNPIVQSQDIPRDRLVTNSELLSLLNINDTRFEAVQKSLIEKDTTQALEALAMYFRNRNDVHYFFDYKLITDRIDLLKQHYPEEIDRIRTAATYFIDTFGADVDWQIPGVNKLGEHHTPNTIRELSRQREAPDIALLGFIDDSPQYSDFIITLINDFASDFEAGKTQAGANHIFERFYAGLRARKWLGTYHILLASPDFQWQDQIQMIKLFILHAAHLYDSGKDFNWGNHQLVGLTGAYEITTMFPEFYGFNEWNERILEVILEHLDKEIEEDGFQFERASHYHKRDIFNYLRVFRLAQQNNAVIPEVYQNKFRKMFDSILHLTMPSGHLPIMHDVTSNIESIIDPVTNEMSLGALLFGDPAFKYFSSEKFPAQYYWLFDTESIANFNELAAVLPEIGSVSLPESQFYIMRSGWTEDDLYLQIDAGLAQHKPDHTHGQVLGVIGYAFGEQILPNYPVRYRDRSYMTLKNSLVKSVALTDNILQGRNWIANKARTGFGAWKDLPTPNNQEWLAGKYFDHFSGSHDGFNIVGVDYTRSIFFFKPYYWVFVDEFSGSNHSSYQQIWQGDYEIDDENNAVTQFGEKANLHIRQADPTSFTISNTSNYGRKSVQFEKMSSGDHRFTTLVYPYNTEIPENLEIREYERSPRYRDSEGDPFFRKVRITDRNREGFIYFSDGYKIDLERVLSDARFVQLSYTDQSLDGALFHQGTHIKTEPFSITTEKNVSAEIYRIDNDKWEIHMMEGESQNVNISISNGIEVVIEMKKGNTYQLW